MPDTNIKLLETRMKTLAISWFDLRDKTKLRNRELFVFNHAIAVKVVKHYAKDLAILKDRYGIGDRAQPPKVAGLMANAVLKYRPLVPNAGKQKDIEENRVNEILAVYHGICICAGYYEGGIDVLRKLTAQPQFYVWLDRFIYLLRERNYTSESLIMIFETLCWVFFPNSLIKNGESQVTAV